MEPWNNGIWEEWVLRNRLSIIIPSFHFDFSPLFHYSSIPLFQDYPFPFGFSSSGLEF